MICKDTNSKAIHNYCYYYAENRLLFMICKDTNSKAIHNISGKVIFRGSVVYDMQRY